MSNVSRRNFFKGAGAAALVAAAAGSLSGCGNGYESNEPVKNDTTHRPSGPSWLGEAPQIDETEITERSITKSLLWVCAPVACRPLCPPPKMERACLTSNK